MSVSPIALGAAATGVLLLWSAINDKPLLTTLGDVIKGQSPAPAPTASQALAQAGTAGNLGAAIDTGVLESQGTPAANKALGLVMAAAYGWTGTEWSYLETGWQEESGWNQYAANDPSDPYNHAYGIPQANPGSKMASAGSNWESSPATQIKWGLGYIKATYGSPSKVPGWSPTGPEAGYVGY
jgi:hypothetical protein